MPRESETVSGELINGIQKHRPKVRINSPIASICYSHSQKMSIEKLCRELNAEDLAISTPYSSDPCNVSSNRKITPTVQIPSSISHGNLNRVRAARNGLDSRIMNVPAGESNAKLCYSVRFDELHRGEIPLRPNYSPSRARVHDSRVSLAVDAFQLLSATVPSY